MDDALRSLERAWRSESDLEVGQALVRRLLQDGLRREARVVAAEANSRGLAAGDLLDLVAPSSLGAFASRLLEESVPGRGEIVWAADESRLERKRRAGNEVLVEEAEGESIHPACSGRQVRWGRDRITLFDASGELASCLPPAIPERPRTIVAAAPSGRILAYCFEHPSLEVRLLDLRSGQEGDFQVSLSPRRLVWSPSGGSLAVVGRKGEVQVLDATQSEWIHAASGPGMAGRARPVGACPKCKSPRINEVEEPDTNGTATLLDCARCGHSRWGVSVYGAGDPLE